MKTRIGFLLVLCATVLFALFHFFGTPQKTMPVAFTKSIEDKAALFDNDQKSGLEEYHNWVLENYDIDIRVITLREQVDIDLYAAKTFTSENVGSFSSTFKGLLFIIDTFAGQVRIEVSGNLESVFTDAFINYIERNQMVPFFEAERLADGVFATTELIRIRAADAVDGKEFDLSNFKGSSGGGAKTAIKIKKEKKKDPNGNSSKAGNLKNIAIKQVYAADTPEESLRRMFKSYTKNEMGNWDVLTPESRKHLQEKISTPAQRMNTVKRFDKCEIDEVVYSEDGRHAVLLYDLAQRECDPFVFEKGDDNKWRVDLNTIGDALGHTYGNIWYIHFERFEQSGFAKYMFGFNKFSIRRYTEEQFSHQGIPYYHSWGLNLSYLDKGVIVTKIHGEDSYFSKTGIKVGDIITHWDSYDHPTTNGVWNRLTHVREGLDVFYRYERDGKEYEGIIKAPPSPKPGSKQYRWGVTIGYDNEYITQTKRWPGPVIHYVASGSIGEKMGFKAGDRIIRWGKDTEKLIPVIYGDIYDGPAGVSISVGILRDGQESELNIVSQKPRKSGEVK